ncbi:MAG TPA: hypothetical protein VGS07_15035 [Thermoanaerobaculia bacterium]|jgi:hypothetical protein|nr:hypothetical protein [Thermoanaerobaculia bacterium]
MAGLTRFLVFLTILVPVAGCATAPAPTPAPKGSFAMNRAAETYVKLVLAVGQHDADYVDAYYGPPEWRAAAEAHKRPLSEIRAEAEALIGEVAAHPAGKDSGDELERLRHAYLLRQLQSMVARIDLVSGKKMTFDEESKALYDAVAPTYDAAHFQQILDRLEKLVPGQGSLPDRVEKFRQRFVIPRERLDAVFNAAVAECRRRTAQHIELPAGESFVVEYVTNKSWSGYNWYKGGFHSLIQVNTDLPIFIDRAVDLACHEGYPGHHVYNALLEQHLGRGRGWPEFSVYPLFSPQSLIAEGTANFGIDVAFPGAERTAFERETLYPLAGLDPSTAQGYAEVRDLLQQLGYAGNEAARGFLDGKISRQDAEAWLVRYGLMSPERAAQRVRFIEQYRSYVINYNLGQDLVHEYIEKRGGTAEYPQQRWDEFAKLISSPRLPSGLR